MRRCRTKKNKKWWVQLIQQRPRPARSGTWCILWRFWTQSLTHGPSVNIYSYWLLPSTCILMSFSVIACFIPSCIVSWDSSCALCLLLRGEMVRSRGKRELKTCMIQNIVQLLLSSTITHFSLPNIALLTTCEYRWVTNDRRIFLWSCSIPSLQPQFHWGNPVCCDSTIDCISKSEAKKSWSLFGGWLQLPVIAPPPLN